jgi:hypothetical protein
MAPYSSSNGNAHDGPHPSSKTSDSKASRKKTTTADLTSKDLQNPPYVGKFSFDHAEMQAYIKEVKLSYREDDPETWPYITNYIIKRYQGV